MNQAGLLFVIGILLYAGLWLGHEAAGIPGRGQGPVWRSPASLIRRALRVGDGPVLIVAALIQLAALLLILRAGALASGSDLGDTTTAFALGGAIIVASATILFVFARARRTL
jgi:hypothetical protein